MWTAPKVLVKATPPGEPSVEDMEPLTLSMTVDRSITVRDFKKALSLKLGGRGPFKLQNAAEELLRDKQGLEDALVSCANNTKGQRKWPKPYAGQSGSSLVQSDNATLHPILTTNLPLHVIFCYRAGMDNMVNIIQYIFNEKKDTGFLSFVERDLAMLIIATLLLP